MSEIVKTQSNWEHESQNESGYEQIFEVLWRRRWWFTGVFSGVMAAAVFLALLKPPVYQSYMQLLVEPNYQNKDTNNDEEDEAFTDSDITIDYATQLNLMRSSSLLQRAVNRLKSKYPTMTVAELKSYLNLYQVIEGEKTETKIFQAVYTTDNPIKSQQVLQAIKAVYLEYNLEQQEKRLKEGFSFIDRQIPEVRQNLKVAEAELKQLRTEYNLIAPEEEASSISATLKDVQKERQSLQAQYQETGGRYQKLQQQLGVSGQEAIVSSRLSQSSRYQNLLNELQNTELELAQQRTKFTEANPTVQELIKERDNKRALLKEEITKVLGTVPPDLDLSAISLEKQGQLGNSELGSTENLAQAQVDLIALKNKDQSLAQTEQKLKQQLDQFPEIIDRYNSLNQEVEVRRSALQKLLEAKQQLGIEINRGGFNWQIVEAPGVGIQVGPNTKKDLMLGGVVALFLGGISAFMIESLDDKLHRLEDLKKKISLPLLGSIPKLETTQKRSFIASLPFVVPTATNYTIEELIEWQPFRESIDLIYENILLFNSGSSLRSLAITSAIAGEGKSTLALALAFSAARRNQKVLVIDADIRSPSLHKSFGVSNQRGLSDLITRNCNKETIQQITVFGSRINLLTAGQSPADPVSFLSNPQLKELITNYEREYDLVLVDNAPLIGMVDAIKVAAHCQSTVMVARLNQVSTSELIEATDLINKLNVLGIVANDSEDIKKVYPNQKYLLPRQV